MIELTLSDLELLLRKYVGEKTPIVAFLVDGRTRVKFSGFIDSVSEVGLVVKDEYGDFAIFDVSGMRRSLLADKRDIPPDLGEMSTQYTSALSLERDNGVIVTVFEK